MSKRGNSDVLAEKKDESFETGSKINLLLPEGAEVVGILEAVTPDALIIRYSGHDTAVSIASDILEKAAQLIGRKVAILHFNHKFYIREIKDPISVSETPANKNRKAKKMKHLPRGGVAESGDVLLRKTCFKLRIYYGRCFAWISLKSVEFRGISCLVMMLLSWQIGFTE